MYGILGGEGPTITKDQLVDHNGTDLWENERYNTVGGP